MTGYNFDFEIEFKNTAIGRIWMQRCQIAYIHKFYNVATYKLLEAGGKVTLPPAKLLYLPVLELVWKSILCALKMMK